MTCWVSAKNSSGLVKIARDTNYKVSEVLQGSKKFMSHDDYLDTVEKTIYFCLGGFDCYIDYVNVENVNLIKEQQLLS